MVPLMTREIVGTITHPHQDALIQWEVEYLPSILQVEAVSRLYHHVARPTLQEGEIRIHHRIRTTTRTMKVLTREASPPAAVVVGDQVGLLE